MRKVFIVLIIILAAVTLYACSRNIEDDFPDAGLNIPWPVFANVDFHNSPFKHINNGGDTASGTMPYNIDAITGATVTVAGPAVTNSIPLSMREIENANEGLFRGVYADSNGEFIYEGLDLYYLLHSMTRGDKGIVLTDTAYSVQLRDSNRELVADILLTDAQKAHLSGRPFLLAFGIGTLDENLIAPFVFDGATSDTHSEGYIPELSNDDGCLKLVYSPDNSRDYSGTFTNVAYIYISEESEPGFKHITASDPIYSTSRYVDYIITFRGDALGAEVNLTTAQLEDLVRYNNDGTVMKGGLGYSDSYSLANNAYWYVNEYEGLDLYKLLLYLGMEDAASMGLAAARTTLVSFIADDGFSAPESFSVDSLSYPDIFGFYKKNAIDMDDGSYISTAADLENTGYPVLLAYGVNGYPYTITKFDDGYLSGLSNNGGPMRVVFGKTQYNHPNGSNQVQFLRNVIVGNDFLYNTHKYTDNMAHRTLADSELIITVNGEDGDLISERLMTVGDVESIIYGEDTAPGVRHIAGVKNHFQRQTATGYVSEIYEGVNIEYLLMVELGLPGTNGTVTFESADGEKTTVNLDTLLKPGYNTQLERDGVLPVLAFSKNGSPMVADENSPGYVGSIPLNPMTDYEPAKYDVANFGGPLAVFIPSSDPYTSNAVSVMQVTAIEINLIPDSYAHINPPYSAFQDNVIHFYGDGLERETELTVGDIISRQTKAKTLDFSILDSAGTFVEQRYRGVSLFDLFVEIGLMSNAGDVYVHDSEGNVYQIPLSTVRSRNNVNYLSPEKEPLMAMLAYGTGIIGENTMLGSPLVPSDISEGYDTRFKNDGGPLMLIIPQNTPDSINAPLCVRKVVAIEVTANEIDSWGHTMSDIYDEFLDHELAFTIRNDDNEWSHVFTVRQIEEMTDIIVRELYSVLDIGECEGIDIWKFIRRFAGNVPGIDDPVSITAIASDGYMNDLLSVFYKEGFELGVPDGEGNRKPLIIAYAVNGLPLVDVESHEGYTGLAGNAGGPLRVVAETNQGASVKYVNRLTIVVSGTGEIEKYLNHERLAVPGSD